MPLVYAGATDAEVAPRGGARDRARKINPEYAAGELVRVAGGRNQAEAELIQNLLLEEGVPSMVRRSAGFDVPDYLAGGPRDVVVPEAGLRAAREILLQEGLAGPDTPEPARPRALLLVAVIGAAAVLTALIAWALLHA